jgi:hypothetical protein
METMDEEEAERLEEELDADYEIAQSFRSHIIPKAVVWFSGEVRTRGIILNLQPFALSLSSVSHLGAIFRVTMKK